MAAYPDEPFITIDPIGNHTVNDVIILNGTTNIPVNETLYIQSGGSWTPSGTHGTQFYTDVIVSPGKNGVNFWTCNISPARWITKGLRWESHDIKYFETGDYIVIVSSIKYNVTSETQIFINPNYFITIDPIGDHSVSDVILINGTTNLPVGETINVENSGNYNRRPKGIYSAFGANVSVMQGNAGVNVWSCNISPVLWWTGGGFENPHDIRQFQTKQYSVIIYTYSDVLKRTLAFNESNEFMISSGESNTSLSPDPTKLPSLKETSTSTVPSSRSPSTPLYLTLPLAAVAGIVILQRITGKK